MDSLADENPFLKIRLWNLFLWLAVSAIPAVIIWYAVTHNIPSLAQSDGARSVFEIIYATIAVLLWTSRQTKKHNLSVKKLFGTVSFRSSDVWRVLCFGVPLVLNKFGTTGLTIYLFYRFNFGFDLDKISDKILMASVDPYWIIIMGIICVGIIAPIIEEMLFRGLFISRASQLWGTKWALVVSSILFGLLHLDPVGATLFGLVMGLIYLQTGRLILPVLFHVINNLAATHLFGVMADVFMDDVGSTKPTDGELSRMLIFAATSLAISIPWLIFIVYRNWPKDWSIPYLRNSQSHVPTLQ